jgi:hypothetical protein
LMAVNTFSISVCMRTPSDEMTRGMLHQYDGAIARNAQIALSPLQQRNWAAPSVPPSLGGRNARDLGGAEASMQQMPEKHRSGIDAGQFVGCRTML